MWKKPEWVIIQEKNREELEKMYPDLDTEDFSVCLFVASQKYQVSIERVTECFLKVHGKKIKNYIDATKKQFQLFTSTLLRTNNVRRMHYLAILLNYMGDSYPPFYPLEDLMLPEKYIELKKRDRNKLIYLFENDKITAETLFDMNPSLSIPKKVFKEYMQRLSTRLFKIEEEKATSIEQKNFLDSLRTLKDSINHPGKYPIFDEWMILRTMRKEPFVRYPKCSCKKIKVQKLPCRTKRTIFRNRNSMEEWCQLKEKRHGELRKYRKEAAKLATEEWLYDPEYRKQITFAKTKKKVRFK